MLKRSLIGGKRRNNVGFEPSVGVALEGEIDEWVNFDRPLIGEILIDEGLLDADDLLAALAYQAEYGGRLGEAMIALGFIDEHGLAAALADQFEIPLADLRVETPQPDAVAAVGEELARRHNVIPLAIEDGRVAVVTAEPLGVDAIRELTEHCQRIRIMMGARSDIDRLLDQVYDVLQSAAAHIQAFELADYEIQEEEGTTLEVDENAPIVQVVNRILMQGVRSRASDIHIEPQEHDIRVRYRIDGALSEAISLPWRMGAPIASRIKVMAELNIVERRRPQDGQFSFRVDHRPIDVRTSVVNTVHGEKIVLRLLDKTRSLISLTELGMRPDMLVPYREIVSAPLGMLLCTGPTGAGKTTTLYATLIEVNDSSKNVVTIEDPVEYQFAGVNQMPIAEGTGMTFADGLRGILRQDPDTILVGEIRDVETARIATQAALTGHFVLSSLHAVDAVAALHRFTDMGIEPFLVASAISGIVGQRLLRRICDSCRQPFEPTSDMVRVLLANGSPEPDEWTIGAGCNMCSGTGYQGRVGVYAAPNRRRRRTTLMKALKQRVEQRGEGGFTLIELLVVIAILGILAAVVVFAVGGITDKGQTSACKIDVRTLRTAEEAYSALPNTPAHTYATQDVLVSQGLLAEKSTLHRVELTGTAGTDQTYHIGRVTGAKCETETDGSDPTYDGAAD